MEKKEGNRDVEIVEIVDYFLVILFVVLCSTWLGKPLHEVESWTTERRGKKMFLCFLTFVSKRLHMCMDSEIVSWLDSELFKNLPKKSLHILFHIMKKTYLPQ